MPSPRRARKTSRRAAEAQAVPATTLCLTGLEYRTNAELLEPLDESPQRSSSNTARSARWPNISPSSRALGAACRRRRAAR